jgi:GT2 family glycosyltransferase
MSVTAVVPVWNGRDLLARLLDTLDGQTVRAAEVIVVDNGSEDGAPEMARKRGARVAAMGRNAGFAPAVNRGIGEARTPWIAVLNSDVELAPDYFEKLLTCDAWYATGKILDATRNGTIDGAFDLTCRGATTWRAGNGKADGPLWNEARRIWSPPWTAVLFRADIFRKVGLLEERFESYLEDVDFGLRCATHGVSGFYLPEAVAWHRGSASLGRWHPETVRRMARNQVFLAARHLPAGYWRHAVVAQSLWGAVAARHGAMLAWARGVAQGVRSFRGARAGRVSSVELVRMLDENERMIHALQAAEGLDLYWKLYLLLTRGGAK